MDIWIPTLGRLAQETLFSLPLDIRKKVILVVSHNGELTGSNVARTPPDVQGIAATRQWIIEHSTQKCVMLDDDLVFAARRDDEPTKFVLATRDDIRRLFEDTERYLDSFAHVGVSTREGGNREVSETVANTRLLRILAYRTDILRKEGIRFDRIPLMEDFDVTLQLLERGYPNIKVNWIVHNQRTSNAPGGCSSYRTMQLQSEAAHALKRLHPEFVTVVTKQTKGAWNGQQRDDVIIQWKKAFDSAGKVAVLDSRTEPSDAEKGPGATETVE